MFPNDIKVRESQIEDIMVTSPDRVKDLLGRHDIPQMISRQMQVAAGRQGHSHINCLTAKEWLKARMGREAML